MVDTSQAAFADFEVVEKPAKNRRLAILHCCYFLVCHFGFHKHARAGLVSSRNSMEASEKRLQIFGIQSL